VYRVRKKGLRQSKFWGEGVIAGLSNNPGRDGSDRLTGISSQKEVLLFSRRTETNILSSCNGWGGSIKVRLNIHIYYIIG